MLVIKECHKSRKQNKKFSVNSQLIFVHYGMIMKDDLTPGLVGKTGIFTVHRNQQLKHFRNKKHVYVVNPEDFRGAISKNNSADHFSFAGFVNLMMTHLLGLN